SAMPEAVREPSLSSSSNKSELKSFSLKPAASHFSVWLCLYLYGLIVFTVNYRLKRLLKPCSNTIFSANHKTNAVMSTTGQTLITTTPLLIKGETEII
ncbi:MAG TPA: hypothetical protein VLL96_06905, partial [Candidatus Deferrimicrobiaceae bacterium]|nr:hypothetical protein [Candidatus Deferrimicrobiaceae bacterium]